MHLRAAASASPLALYQTFIEKAGDDSSYRDAVARAKEKLADLRETLEFMGKE